MSVPILSGSYANNVDGPASVSYAHNGGRVLVWWMYTTRTGTPPTSCTIDGVAATLLLSTTTLWRVWGSAQSNIAAGTITVAFPGTGASTRAGVFIRSVANWTGAVTLASFVNATAYTRSLVTAANDLAVVVWQEAGDDPSVDSPQLGVTTGTAEASLFDADGVNYNYHTLMVRRAGLGGATALTVFEQFGGSFTNRSAWMVLTGVTTQTFTQAVAGNLNFSGAIGRASKLNRSGNGNLSFSGAINRTALIKRAPAGNLSFSGAIARLALLRREMAGALSFGGALQTLKIPAPVQVALAGVLSFSGALQRTSTRTLSGVLSWVGTLVAKTAAKKDVAGSLDFQGSLTKTFTVGRILDGTLSFLGDLGTAFTAAPRRFVVALFAQLTVVHNRLRR